MDECSPWYQFHPDSPGWINRRHRSGEHVSGEDVARVIEANPDLIRDPVIRDLVIRGLRNELKARRGRKRTTSRILKELWIMAIYDDLLPKLQARANRQKAQGLRRNRGDRSPAECAHKLIGARFAMEEESVRNLISSLKNRP